MSNVKLRNLEYQRDIAREILKEVSKDSKHAHADIIPHKVAKSLEIDKNKVKKIFKQLLMANDLVEREDGIYEVDAGVKKP